MAVQLVDVELSIVLLQSMPSEQVAVALDERSAALPSLVDAKHWLSLTTETNVPFTKTDKTTSVYAWLKFHPQGHVLDTLFGVLEKEQWKAEVLLDGKAQVEKVFYLWR